MFKYFSISDLQYFLKNGLVFHSNLNFLISKFLSIKFVLHFNVQMTGSVSKAGTILPQNSTCKILQPYGASLVGYNFSHLHWRRIFWPLVGNLATKFKIWSSGGATCIGSNVVHQVGSHALPHCLELPYWHYQLVLTWYLHQPESHQLSLNKVSHLLTDRLTYFQTWWFKESAALLNQARHGFLKSSGKFQSRNRKLAFK